MIVKSNAALSSGIYKLWSTSNYGKGIAYNQEARDVALTNDGGIFVTGWVSGWSTGGQVDGGDCYVLRLDN
jgi:hypothetical protein